MTYQDDGFGDPDFYDREEVDQDDLDDRDAARDEGDPEDDDEGPMAGFDDEGDDRLIFANPGGNSALRAASRTNPRNLPCPTCRRENMLTPKDVALGYQCDHCADSAEGRGP